MFQSRTPSLLFARACELFLDQIRHTDDGSVGRIGPRKVKIEVEVTHEGPAYLEEEFPIHVNVLSRDDVEAEVILDFGLQFGESSEQYSAYYFLAGFISIQHCADPRYPNFQMATYSSSTQRRLLLPISKYPWVSSHLGALSAKPSA